MEVVLDMTLNYDEVPVLESTSSLPLLPVQFWPEVLVPLRVLFVGQIDLFKKILIFNRTMCKKKQTFKK